ncbi:hypothetical protein [Aurantimonas sp. VKM B-3413]|uniref:hypothetical protein n=1 Tax=Aurantimonas sp. VKM B-3413 TaxID=2779401 RepID=UPI001E3061CC|nr:hypothetical protein [Aurantimonas sp. VKM B-3413]MCB8836089.1 hypothetical protein [Aurantimonas sp. VKM B-3413]
MDDTKPWYLSRTIWGSVVALAAAGAGIFGYEVDAGTNEALTSALIEGAGAVGAIVAIYGRLAARSTIG